MRVGPLGCGVQTGAGSVMRALGREADASIAVLGGGSVGLSGVMGAVLQGCTRIIVVEPNRTPHFARSRSNSERHVIDPADQPDLTAALRAVVLGIDVMTLLLQGYRLKGSAEGDVDPAAFIPHLADLNAAGKFPFDRRCVTYPLADIDRAIEHQHAGMCVKPVLLP